MGTRSELVLIESYQILTQEEVKLLTEYASWCKKSYLAEKIEKALQMPAFLGTFADVDAANASNHPGLTAGNFVPGDRYFDTDEGSFFTNTATTIGAATWTSDITGA